MLENFGLILGTCLPFVKSRIFCEQMGCDTDAFNDVSAYVDLSNVYGKDELTTAAQIRAFSGEYLRKYLPKYLPK
jgi:hypothetical protein